MVPRDQLVLATKAYYPMRDDPNARGLSRKHLLEAVDGSLRRMQTDYIDLFVIHAFDSHTPVEETMRALNAIVLTGKVRYVAVCNWPAWMVMKKLNEGLF